jgi:hypothetical protein
MRPLFGQELPITSCRSTEARFWQEARDGFKAAGKKLDMGKACIRFRAADDLPLNTVGKIVASTPLERFVSMAKAAQRR